MAEKWFGSIEKRNPYSRDLPIELVQQKKRELSVERDVPNDAIYMAFHMDKRSGKDFHTIDLISDLL